MKLLFNDITRKTRRYTIDDSSWVPGGSDGFFVTAKAKITVSKRDSETVLLKGDLDGQYMVACDRCGEQVKKTLHCEFVYLVSTREEQALELRDIECNDEDAITLYLKEPEIDIDEILREQAYLFLPLGNLCSKDCKGICAGCGVTLNSEACRCSLDKGHPAFAVLKKLTNN